MKRVSSFLHFISFADRNIISSCSHFSKWMYSLIGLTILLTGGLAVLSGFFAVMVIYKNPIVAVFVGLFWGLMVVSFDRGLFLAKSKWMAVVRMFLALCIGVVVSVPLELHILQDEIQVQIDKDYKGEYGYLSQDILSEDESYQKELRGLEAQINNLNDEVSNADLEMNAEEKGFSGKGGRYAQGKGARYNFWKDEKDRLLDRIKEKNGETEDLKKHHIANIDRLEKKKAIFTNKKPHSLLSQMIAVKRLEKQGGARGEMTIKVSWGLRILFVMIEVFPAILKLSLPKTDYNTFSALIENRNSVIESSMTTFLEQELADLQSDPNFIPNPSYVERVKERMLENQI